MMTLPSIYATEEIIFLLSKLAMAYLIRGNELELAVCVGTVLGDSAAPATHYALELLARKCMMIPMW
jgi:hypothetical protein